MLPLTRSTFLRLVALFVMVGTVSAIMPIPDAQSSARSRGIHNFILKQLVINPL